jgi:hypothetical protein
MQPTLRTVRISSGASLRRRWRTKTSTVLLSISSPQP